MKILHIIQNLKQGGIEQFAFSMLCLDVKNVYILALEGSSMESFWNWPKLKQYRSNLFFANKKAGISFKTVHFIRDICRTLNISVIHTHHIGPLILWELGNYKESINQTRSFRT